MGTLEKCLCKPWEPAVKFSVPIKHIIFEKSYQFSLFIGSYFVLQKDSHMEWIVSEFFRSSTSHSRRKPGWRFTAGVQFGCQQLVEMLSTERSAVRGFWMSASVLRVTMDKCAPFSSFLPSLATVHSALHQDSRSTVHGLVFYIRSARVISTSHFCEIRRLSVLQVIGGSCKEL